jgi:starch synthase
VKILFAAAEAAPYFRTGGLGDVARALPDELVAAGHDVRILVPYYGVIEQREIDALAVHDIAVPWPGGAVPVRLRMHRPSEDGATAVLVEQPAFFREGTPYDAGSVMATALRFAFFSRTVVEFAGAWQPDVIHANDWQTGFVPVYGLTTALPCPTVFAIHNLAYQGIAPAALLAHAGVPWDLLRTENGVEFFGAVSFMKAGLSLSDRLVTVSATYADEIQSPAYGAGLDGLLRFRRRTLHGILNGIDVRSWNPSADPAIAAAYSSANLGPKEQNRAALLAETSLDDGGPILSMVTRLAYQKGVDIMLEALPGLLALGARIVVLGDGDPGYAEALARAAAANPTRVHFFSRFDDRVARRIYAGSDFFLMPSRYEPCGLGQMIAQRYGTPPIVRRTGGLLDTVEDGRTGFAFDPPTPRALIDAAARAVAVWQRRGWVSLRRRCMRLDRSWKRSARLYAQVYRLATGRLDEEA